jgi:hypothetical protein
MNDLLRAPICLKRQRVLPPGARHTVKYACAPSGPRHAVFSGISTPSRRLFMNGSG